MTVYANKPAFNVREKLKELEKPSGVAGNAMLRAETPQEQFNLIGAGRRNLIINGGFDVWQRGTSFISAGTGYAADRFRHLVYGGATPDITKVAGFGDFRNAIRYTGVDGSAGAQIEVEHRIEATSLPQTGNLTLSYWVRGSKAGSVRTGRIINGSTGATNTGYGSIEVSTEWSRVTVTVATLSATEAQYYRLFVLDSLLSYMSDNSVWLEMTGIQLEAGSVVTPFEHRSYGEELALCQRYYQMVSDKFTAQGTYWSAEYFSSYHMPVTMLRSPTFLGSRPSMFKAFGAGSAPTSTAVVAGEAGESSIELQVTIASVGVSAFIRFAASTDWFSLEAEL